MIDRESTFSYEELTNLQKLEIAFKELEIEDIWEFAKKIQKNAIRINHFPIEESLLKLGQSKVGGRPDLPVNVNWPNYKSSNLNFLVQINLNDIQGLDLDSKLPKSGILYFFEFGVRGWGELKNFKELELVYYYDSELLERKEFPDDVRQYQCCELKFNTEISLPHVWSLYRDELLNYGRDLVDIYHDALDYGSNLMKLLGYPDNFQSPVERECEWEYNESIDNNGNFINERLNDLNPQKWQLLFQFDDWFDTAKSSLLGGRYYFMITKDDLEKKHFKNVIMLNQR